MAHARDFKDTIRARVARDPRFRKELLREGINSMIDGDLATAKTVLRDYSNFQITIRSISSSETSSSRRS